MDVFIQYAIAASQFAMDDARLTVGAGQRRRASACSSPRASAGSAPSSASTRRCSRAGRGKISPFFIPAAIINLAAGQVSIRFGAKGPNSATCTACSASAHAIGDAFEIIQRGDADVMIAGGSEAAITPMGVGGFAAMRALSTRNDEPERASRPFDKDRDGFVDRRGRRACSCSRSSSSRRRRGARIYAELVGYGMSGRRVPHHGAVARTATARVRVDAGGAARAPASTRRTCGYINAHGTSTPLNDKLETTGDQAAASASTPASSRSRRPSR